MSVYLEVLDHESGLKFLCDREHWIDDNEHTVTSLGELSDSELAKHVRRVGAWNAGFVAGRRAYALLPAHEIEELVKLAERTLQEEEKPLWL